MSLFLRMKHPAANIGVSSSPLDRHSVLDTESSQIFWIPALVRLRRVRRYDDFAASRGEFTQKDSPLNDFLPHLTNGRGVILAIKNSGACNKDLCPSR